MSWNEWNETERIKPLQYSRYISKGQTLIVRYYMVLNEEKSYDLQFSLTSTIGSDNSLAEAFEVNKLFIASAGYNFPCVHPKLGSTYIVVNANSVPIGANLNIGDLDRVSMYQNNISANMVL